MKIAPLVVAALLLTCPGVALTSASAQIKPMHSGALSHNAPQMRRHGSGLYRPNRPHHHHHKGYPGYHHHGSH